LVSNTSQPFSTPSGKLSTDLLYNSNITGWLKTITMEKLKSAAGKLGVQLSAGQLEQFQTYYLELVEWNRRINLTTITDYEEVQTKHFLDSLTVILALKQCSKYQHLSVIDVGTGAGMPGLPLKIALPPIRLTLLDATAKKAAFLEHLKRKLALDFEIPVGRAEETAHSDRHRERYGIVLSRAVAPMRTLVELTLPFCKIGGTFIALKKGEISEEIGQAENAIGVLGGSLKEVNPVELEELFDQRLLVVIDKVSATPSGYPRRAGMPSKRPLV
jgi:16S rRNA (guanine527-N7)-methyltransferase